MILKMYLESIGVRGGERRNGVFYNFKRWVFYVWMILVGVYFLNRMERLVSGGVI